MKTELRTPQEEELIQAYRSMDDQARMNSMTFVLMQARTHPAPPSRPRLQVVAGDDQPKPTRRRSKAPSLSVVRSGAA